MNGPFPSAEVFARAIVAAAAAYGDNPVSALCAPRHGRRCVTAAAVAVAKMAGLPASKVGRLLKVDDASLSRAGGANAALQVKGAILAAHRAALKVWRAEASRAWTPTPKPSPPPASGPTVLTASAAQRRVQARLMEEPATAPDLAEAIGISEAQVREALSALAERRAVLADPITQEGWRAQFWRVSGGAE